MNDSDSGDNKTTGRGSRGGSVRSSVRQSFSHGRSRAVVVEKKRKRFVATPEGAGKSAAGTGTLTVKPKPKVAPPPRPEPEKADRQEAKPRDERGGAMLRSLSEEEYARRLVAL